MRVVDSALLLAGIASSATAVNVPRALPNAPNGYAPANVTCPETRPSIRSASKLSPNETAWQQVRLNSTTQAMKDFFSAVKIADFDAVKFLNGAAAGQPPNVAIAVSGGGYRAMLTGAGVVKAFDSRSDEKSAPGSTGGVLQSSTYLAGLSGGSWLVASIYANNFTTISALQDDTAGEAWRLGRSITEGPSSGPFGPMNTSSYLMNVVEQVNEKAKAGFNTTVTDAWARMLSFQFINATDGGPAYTWSSFALDSQFTSGNMPMPLVVACAQTPQVNGLSLNLTTIEFTPFEFGSWDPSINGFAPMEYLGSSFDGGDISSSGSCVRGFDDVGFVLGTSSSLFNELVGTSLAASLLTPLTGLFGSLGMIFDKADEYVAEYVNPFFNWKQSSAAFSGVRSLNLFDGGENLEVIPLQPLIQPERKVDVIFAVDVSGDTTYGWPNGSSLRATYERTSNKLNVGQGASFPTVPDANTFVNLGLNTRPTFFGCNSSNFSTATPLVVYLPNYPYTTASNTSTFDMSYNNSQRDAMILNGYQVATMGNGTRDSNWSTCVGCAMLSRSFDRTNTTVPAACASCFQAYCWDGAVNSTTPAPYEPAIGFTSTINSGNSTGSSSPTTSATGTSTSSTQSGHSATGSSAADSATVPSVVVSVLGAVLALFVSI